MKARVIYGLAAMFLLAAIAGSVQAASKSRLTTISVGLHCAGCGKKVVEALKKVPNVAEARPDAEKDIVVVIPPADRLPSPKAQWEAVERAGYKPTKLEGPQGTFDSKPEK